jgi:hypothetical protein
MEGIKAVVSSRVYPLFAGSAQHHMHTTSLPIFLRRHNIGCAQALDVASSLPKESFIGSIIMLIQKLLEKILK